MSKWRHEKAFASWLGLCPNHKVSGERVLSSRTRKVNNRAATTLRLAAMMLGKTDTPLGATAAARAARSWPCLRSNCGKVTARNKPPFQIGYNCSTAEQNVEEGHRSEQKNATVDPLRTMNVAEGVALAACVGGQRQGIQGRGIGEAAPFNTLQSHGTKGRIARCGVRALKTGANLRGPYFPRPLARLNQLGQCQGDQEKPEATRAVTH